jgi:D-alanyl-D-alanine carboxypeptidase
VLVVSVAAHAFPPAPADRVDAYVLAQMRQRHIPGLSLAVVQHGKVVKATGYGMANVELSVQSSASSVYELASMTKQFTAMAILILHREQKLSLDDPVSKYVPEVPDTWRGVTIRHLLTHTSGIPSHTELPQILNDESRDYTRTQMLAIITAPPVKNAPGEQWAYNDSGYFLLGLVVENASHQRYDEFMHERIFRLLGMMSTRGNDIDDVIPHRAAGYILRDGRLRRGRAVSPTQSFGGGHLVSTVLDLAKWDLALAGDKLLPRSALETMWTPARLKNDRRVEVDFTGFEGSSYGFGWMVGQLGRRRIVEHVGSISSGFSNEILRFPDDGITVIVLANRSQDPPFAEDAPRPWAIARGVAALYIPDLARD